MIQTDFDTIRTRVITRLGILDPCLTYHNIRHTLDVTEQAEGIARAEGIRNEKEIFLLKTASLYHDTGFLYTYTGHEEESCNIFMEDSTNDQFSTSDIKIITELIMSTKLPQKPHTLLEKIICDADLDYLGRKDFFMLGKELRKEFLHFGIVGSLKEWNELQIHFLKNHEYHTAYSRRNREPLKQKNIDHLSTATGDKIA